MPTANKRNERIRGEVQRLAMLQRSGADVEPGGDMDHTETVTAKQIAKKAPKAERRESPEDDMVDLLPDSEGGVGAFIEQYGQFDEDRIHPGIKRIMERAEFEGVPFGGYPRRRGGMEVSSSNDVAEAAAAKAVAKTKLPKNWVGMGGIQYTQNNDGSLKVFFPKANRTAVVRPGDDAYHAILSEWQQHGDQSGVNWSATASSKPKPTEEAEPTPEAEPEGSEIAGSYDMRQDMPGGGQLSIDPSKVSDIDEAEALKLITDIQAGGVGAQDAKARYDDNLKSSLRMAAAGPFAFPMQVTEKTGASLVSMLPEGNLKRVGESIYGTEGLGDWVGRTARDVGRVKEDVTPYLFDTEEQVQAGLEERKAAAVASPEAFKAFILDDSVPLEVKLDLMMENPELAE